MIAMGIGCRRGCSAAAIVSLIRKTLTAMGAPEAELYTITDKQDEAGLLEAASVLKLPLFFLPLSRLEGVVSQVQTCSALVQERFGIPSISEAAALAGAGEGAKLIMTRVAENGVTCAVAVSGDVRNDK